MEYQLSGMSQKTRFASEIQLERLAPLGKISHIATEIRVSFRNHLLAASSPAEYGDKLISANRTADCIRNSGNSAPNGRLVALNTEDHRSYGSSAKARL